MDTRKELASLAGVSHGTMEKARKVAAELLQDVKRTESALIPRPSLDEVPPMREPFSAPWAYGQCL